MPSHMPPARLRKARSFLRAFASIGGLAIAATAAVSCTALEGGIIARSSVQHPASTAVKLSSPKRGYAYETAQAAPVLLAAAELADDATARPFQSGSPYICTPSGFGQKARCLLR